MSTFTESFPAAIRELMDALAEIGAIAGMADKHLTRETEYADSLTPKALALIELRSNSALETACAILRSGIQE